MTGLDLLCLGEPLVEFNHQGGSLWQQGFGGDVANVAVAAARQGARAGLVTRLGNDGFGQALRDLWAAEGVDAGAVTTDADAATGVYFVRHGPDGHSFEYRRAGSAASRMEPATLPRAAIASAGILHLSGISQAISASARASCDAAIATARTAGTRVSYDPNLRLALWPIETARPAILGALATADIALPGLEDARQLLEPDDPAAIVAAIHALGPRVVALTLGRDGALVSDGGQAVHIPGLPVEAVDATGAGDCFDGAFLARLAAGDAPAAAGRYAVAAASLATRSYGAVAPIPTAAAVRAALTP